MKSLSKSRYNTFCQCPKAFWLKIYRPELEEANESIQAHFEQGSDVGELAKGLLGPYVDVSSFREDGSPDLNAMVERTSHELKKGTANIELHPKSWTKIFI